MNVIVTGANGFIGTNIIRKLFDNGFHVIPIVQDESMDVSGIAGFCERIIFCDIRHIDTLHDQLFGQKGQTIFLNLAWRGVNGEDKGVYSYQLENIEMLCNAALFAKSIGCSKFVSAGTIAEYSVMSLDSMSVAGKGLFYGVAKYSGHLFLETLCKNIGLPFVWAQFSNIYGPKNKTGNLISYTLTQLSKGLPAEFGPADQPYDFIFLDDLIEALYRVLTFETTSDFFCLSSGQPRLLKDYLFYIGKRLGKESLINIGKKPSDGVRYSFSMFDNRTLIQEIGNYVSTPFEEGIEKTIKGDTQ